MITFSITKKDFELTWFSGTGGGGQHRNRHRNCCRLKHIETGVITTGQSHKEARSNKREALENMAKHWKIKAFLAQKLAELELGETIKEAAEKAADELMAEENIVEETDKDFRLKIRGKKKEIIDGCEVYSPM